MLAGAQLPQRAHGRGFLISVDCHQGMSAPRRLGKVTMHWLVLALINALLFHHRYAHDRGVTSNAKRQAVY